MECNATFLLSVTRLFLVQHLLRVIPVIGILSNRNAFNPAPNADEVEAVFDAPLEMFIQVFPFSVLLLFSLIFL